MFTDKQNIGRSKPQKISSSLTGEDTDWGGKTYLPPLFHQGKGGIHLEVLLAGRRLWLMKRKLKNLGLMLGILFLFLLAALLPLFWLLYNFSPINRVLSQVVVIGLLVYFLILLFSARRRSADSAEEVLAEYPDPEQEKAAAEKANYGQAVGSVVHEIRKPLSRLQLRLEQLAESDQLNELPEEIDELSRTVKRVEQVFEDEAFQPRWISVPRLFYELMQSSDWPGNGELTFFTDLSWVYCDPHQLRLALVNLVRNSLQANQRSGNEGTVRLGCTRVGPEVCWRVRDWAGGMDPELARVINGQKNNLAHHGMGLGLTLVRKICRNHRGRMMVDSEPGEGTEVTLTLPQCFEKSESSGA